MVRIFLQIALIAALATLAASVSSVGAVPRFAEVAVSDGGSGNSIKYSNSTRSVAIGPDGTVYVAYHGSLGTRVARSLDGGASFLPSVRVSTSDAEQAPADLFVDQSGVVYAAWIRGGRVYLTTSGDGGATWVPRREVGRSDGATVRVAVNPPFVYLLPNSAASLPTSGSTLLRSDAGGEGTFTSVPTGLNGFYADLHLDPQSGALIVLADGGVPEISYIISTDNGATFGAPIKPGGGIFYATSALSVGPAGRFLFVSGSEPASQPIPTGYRIDLDVGTSTPLPVPSNGAERKRTLAADLCGNFVAAHPASGGFAYSVSGDGGASFGAATGIPASGQYLSAAINPTNGDLVFAYEHNGAIFASTFAQELQGCPTLAVNGGLILQEGTSAAISNNQLLTNAPYSLPEQTAYSLSVPPAHGILLLNDIPLTAAQGFTQADINGGRLVYAHDGSESTGDSFSFTAQDGRGRGIAPAAFAISITPVNDPPTVANDLAEATAGLPVAIAPLANDSDPEGAPLTIIALGQPTHGTLADEGGGLVRYTPDASYSGSDSFTYTVSDPDGTSASATVTVQVAPRVWQLFLPHIAMN